MTGPHLEVDPVGLDHLARDLVAMSNSLTEEAVDTRRDHGFVLQPSGSWTF